MRPSLSPFENGAYGMPSSVVDEVTGGPHSSSTLSWLIVSARLIPGILILMSQRRVCKEARVMKMYEMSGAFV